ncbi:MAG: helix-hairpin-helix domain-containing protein [Candidatus Omnitrophica bacterium]|nr:helix-hairpin-helix domain-containing protein [Candidatus Omnitrophota bacterium]
MSKVQLVGWMVMAIMIANFFLYPATSALAQTVRANGSAVAAQAKPISINKADAEGLQAVRGIGPALAERIIDFRSANGGFKSLEELKEVRGIGDAKFEKMKGQLTL